MATSRLEKIGSIYSRVEGLLRSGAMKSENRPLWWDVYRAFPPYREPVFYQPVADAPINQIFYEEDLIRAKFHKCGLPTGTVSFSDNLNKSPAQRFLEMYNTMKNESVDESEESVFEKCVENFRSKLTEQERNNPDEKISPERNQSFTTMLRNAQKTETPKTDLKDIFEK